MYAGYLVASFAVSSLIEGSTFLVLVKGYCMWWKALMGLRRRARVRTRMAVLMDGDMLNGCRENVGGPLSNTERPGQTLHVTSTSSAIRGSLKPVMSVEVG